ncbi:hypothetical protein C9I50_05040 [Pseudomonas prosekii]|nr:hypothetical protein C9I50_05040 [Pseudomonas prosekii]
MSALLKLMMIPVGASLLAMAVGQPALMLNEKLLSRASSLPHWFCVFAGIAHNKKAPIPGALLLGRRAYMFG